MPITLKEQIAISFHAYKELEVLEAKLEKEGRTIPAALAGQAATKNLLKTQALQNRLLKKKRSKKGR